MNIWVSHAQGLMLKPSVGEGSVKRSWASPDDELLFKGTLRNDLSVDDSNDYNPVLASIIPTPMQCGFHVLFCS